MSLSLAPISLAISSFNLLGKETSKGYVHWWVLFFHLFCLVFVLVYFFHTWWCPEVNSWHCTQDSLLTGLGRWGVGGTIWNAWIETRCPHPKTIPQVFKVSILATVLSLRPRMFTLFGKCAHPPPLFFSFTQVWWQGARCLAPRKPNSPVTQLFTFH